MSRKRAIYLKRTRLLVRRYPVMESLAVGESIVTEGSFLLRAECLKSASAIHSP
jgi:hypothetical protein